ncbi:MAG: LysR family transcriptional regulator [Pseudomonadota bacterium]
MDRLTSMRIFATVVDLGAFTAAADRLDLSRAAVSKHVADLEQSLGSRLLNRTTRSISLTEAGEVYFSRCKQILDDIETAESEVNGLSTEPRGVLKLNAPMSFGQRRLGPLLAEFQRRYSQLELDVSLNDRLIDVVEEGYDLVIRISKPEDSSLVARRIAQCRFAIAAAPGYLERHGTPQTPEELSDHTCLQYSYAWAARQWHFCGPDGEHVIDTSGPLIANNGELLCAAATAEMGVCLLPTFILCDALNEGTLVQVLPGYAPPPIGVYLVFPTSRLMSAKVRCFIDFMVEAIGDPPAWDVGLPLVFDPSNS